LAEQAQPLKSLIDPRDARFVRPNDMPRKIATYCHETNQTPPETPGETIRCVLESLALSYYNVLQEIQEVTSRKVKYLHVVGGGSKNELLNQLSANAAHVPVLAGPSEATAIGNILIQAMALHHLGSLNDVRRVVRRSFPVKTYVSEEESTWHEAHERFQRLIARS
jgi:rhamnulokinase